MSVNHDTKLLSTAARTRASCGWWESGHNLSYAQGFYSLRLIHKPRKEPYPICALLNELSLTHAGLGKDIPNSSVML